MTKTQKRRRRRRRRKRKAHPLGNQSSKRGRLNPAKSNNRPVTRRQKHIRPSARWCHPPSGDTIFFFCFIA
jgi:hypothetical protein